MNINLDSILTIESILVFLTALCLSGSLTLITVWLYKIYDARRAAEEFESDFQNVLSSEFDTGDDELSSKETILDRWNNYWKDKSKKAGVGISADGTPRNYGRDVLLISGFVSLVIFALSLNIIFAALGFIIVPVIYTVFLSIKANQIQKTLNSQIPAFLAAFKANNQVTKTPEKALMRVIDDIGGPLYSELLPTKRKIQSGSDFNEALDSLKERTTSKDLRFLCSCIKVASNKGVDLDEQIDTIQEVIAERQKVSNKLDSAANSARPAIIVGTLAIPIVFIATYLLSEDARNFWFIDPLSFVSLIIIILFYVFGMWMTKKMVDNLRKM